MKYGLTCVLGVLAADAVRFSKNVARSNETQQLRVPNNLWSIQEQCHPTSDIQPAERANWHYVVVKKVMASDERALKTWNPPQGIVDTVK